MADLHHCSLCDRLPVPLYRRRMDGPWRAVDSNIRIPPDAWRPGRGPSSGRSDRYPSAAQRPQRRRFRGDPLPEPGGGGRPSPIETLDRGWGSCRDFAVLFVEAARHLGFGARLVSGYLFNPDQMLLGSTDAGSTHAWGEVFVSGAGWISFDPTNRSVGGANLVPVAVVRDIRQATPVSGAYVGAATLWRACRSRSP